MVENPTWNFSGVGALADLSLNKACTPLLRLKTCLWIKAFDPLIKNLQAPCA